jgi:hypothetical protein
MADCFTPPPMPAAILERHPFLRANNRTAA